MVVPNFNANEKRGKETEIYAKNWIHMGSHMLLHGSHMLLHGAHMLLHGSHMLLHGAHMLLHGAHMLLHGSHMLLHGATTKVSIFLPSFMFLFYVPLSYPSFMSLRIRVRQDDNYLS